MNDNTIETIEVKLPYCKKTALIRKRPTGADKEAILSVMLNASDISVDNDGKSTTKVDAMSQLNLTRLKIRRFVVQVAGSPGNPDEILELVTALDANDYDAVVDKLNEITKDINPDDDDNPKKNSTKKNTKN